MFMKLLDFEFGVHNFDIEGHTFTVSSDYVNRVNKLGYSTNYDYWLKAECKNLGVTLNTRINGEIYTLMTNIKNAIEAGRVTARLHNRNELVLTVNLNETGNPYYYDIYFNCEKAALYKALEKATA